MLSLNWIDYLILTILVFYAYEGYVNGFISALLDLISFVASFLLGLRFYGFAAGILLQKFSLPQGLADAIGFFLVVSLAQIILGILLRNFLSFDPPFLKTLNKILGILPGILSGAILISFALVLIVTLPIVVPIKRSISSSQVGNFLIASTQGWEKSINQVFGGAINETINFLTIEPKGNEAISLNYKIKEALSDAISEQKMFELINQERSSRRVGELVFDNQLRNVGRKHCEDMFKQGYFSHYTPDGLSPFDRLDEAGILYSFAGENLALSPNTKIAMQGLMNSPGHKANILSVNFNRVGVGVIDGGIYGEIFCQEFAD